MIHLINCNNKHLYRRELEEFHRERHRQFVLERGWSLRSVDGGEYDDYDDEHALYLVGLGFEGGIEVGCRIRTTAFGGVLPDVFPHLIADGEPSIREAGAYECTRYFAVSSARGRRGFEARSKLHLAMLELVRDLGGHRLLGFVDLPFLTHLRRFSGLRIRPVGLPAAYEAGVTIAFEIGVEDADLRTAQQLLQIPTRQLFLAPAWLPDGTDVLSLAQAVTVLTSAPAEEKRALVNAVRRTIPSVVFQPDVDQLIGRLAIQAAEAA